MTIHLFGFSHLECIHEAYAAETPQAGDCRFFFLRDEEFGGATGPAGLHLFDLDRIRGLLAETASTDLVAVSIRGNESSASTMVDLKLPAAPIHRRVEKRVRELTFPWLDLFAAMGRRVLVVSPPPPLPAAHILAHPKRFAQHLQDSGISSPAFRIAAWQHHVALLRDRAAELGLEFLEMPAEVFDGDGLLRAELAHHDPVHGNERLGAILLARLRALATASSTRTSPSAS